MTSNIEQQLACVCRDDFIGTIGDNILPSLLGRIIGQKPEDPSVQAMLCEIPGETSAAERYALYHWFRYLWNGAGDCLEVGPFLGGTSRAIALGMLNNSSRNPTSRFITVDRFNHYYRGDNLVKYLTPLFTAGKLPREWQTSLKGQHLVSFLDVYKYLHMSTAYSSILSIEEGTLCDKPQDLNNEGQPCFDSMFSSPTLGALFIDGCKSWFSIKYLISNLAKRIVPGTFVISQDYGWLTCFWLPVFFEIFSDHFELLACVDTSYFFRVSKELNSDSISENFPDHPRNMDKNKLLEIFSSIAFKASARGDMHGLVACQLQKACAQAVLGDYAEAYKLVCELKEAPYYKLFDRIINLTHTVLDRKFVLDPDETHMSNTY